MICHSFHIYGAWRNIEVERDFKVIIYLEAKLQRNMTIFYVAMTPLDTMPQ